MSVESLSKNLQEKIEKIDFLTRVPSLDGEKVLLGCRVMTDLGWVNILDHKDNESLNRSLSSLEGEEEELENKIGLVISEDTPVAKVLINSKVGEKKEYLTEDGRKLSIEIGKDIEVSPLLIKKQ